MRVVISEIRSGLKAKIDANGVEVYPATGPGAAVELKKVLRGGKSLVSYSQFVELFGDAIKTVNGPGVFDVEPMFEERNIAATSREGRAYVSSSSVLIGISVAKRLVA